MWDHARFALGCAEEAHISRSSRLKRIERQKSATASLPILSGRREGCIALLNKFLSLPTIGLALLF
jgi:hypothetical protein